MKYVLPMIVGVFAVAGCQAPKPAAVDVRMLAEKFVKPGGGQAVAGVVFNKQGEAIAVTADGQLAQSCRLPAFKGDTAQPRADVAKLPECHGVTGTTIFNISHVAAVRHQGTSCIVFSMAFDGTATPPQQICWEP